MISSICSHHDYQFFFFFNDPAPTEIYPLPLHDALPIFAMRRALLALPVCPTHVQVDGNRCPWVADLPLPCTLEAIVRGDALVAAISAASILAKVHRDAMMRALDACYPGFALARHKGYGTPAHLEALARRPPSPLHRRSFSPLRRSGDT